MTTLQPKEVFSIFEQICQIPRPSKQEQRISQWLVDFAASHGIACQRDAALNVVMRVPAKYRLGKNYTLPAIPDPFVELFSLNASDITFVVRAWVRATDYWDVYFLMNQRFYTELPQHGFSFAYPHVVVSAESDEK